MIDVNVNVDSFDFKKVFGEHIKERIRAGEVECQTEDCPSRSFDVEVWENQHGDIEGAAVCHRCETRTHIDFDNESANEVQQSFDELERALKDLENVF